MKKKVEQERGNQKHRLEVQPVNRNIRVGLMEVTFKQRLIGGRYLCYRELKPEYSKNRKLLMQGSKGGRIPGLSEELQKASVSEAE